jgi:hypothetical protein
LPGTGARARTAACPLLLAELSVALSTSPGYVTYDECKRIWIRAEQGEEAAKAELAAIQLRGWSHLGLRDCVVYVGDSTTVTGVDLVYEEP